MLALQNILSKVKTPQAKRLLGKLGWVGLTATATGGMAKGMELAQEELSGRNSAKRAILRKIDSVTKTDPVELMAKAGDLYRSFNKGNK